MKLLLSGLLFVLTASLSFAGLGVELDLDGTLANGPDFVVAAVSDYVNVDVWVTGTGTASVLFIRVCNLDGSLEFQGGTQGPGIPNWGFNLNPVGGQNCVDIDASDLEKTGLALLVPPALVATLVYHAAVDNSCDDLTVDLPASLFIDGTGVHGFDGAMNCMIDIGGGCVSATEENNWGAVKGLFR